MEQDCKNRINETERINLQGDKFAERLYKSESVIADNHIDGKGTFLTRGQYKTVFTIPDYSGEPQTFDNELRKISFGDEYKRVQFHKVDFIPTENGGAKVTAVYTLVDNPVPVIGIVAGALSIGGLALADYNIQKVIEFVEDNTVALWTLGFTLLGTLLYLGGSNG